MEFQYKNVDKTYENIIIIIAILPSLSCMIPNKEVSGYRGNYREFITVAVMFCCREMCCFVFFFFWHPTSYQTILLHFLNACWAEKTALTVIVTSFQAHALGNLVIPIETELNEIFFLCSASVKMTSVTMSEYFFHLFLYF